MRMEIPRKPPCTPTNNRECGFFLIELFDGDRVGFVCAFPDIRNAEDDGPTACLDWTGKISIARVDRADYNALWSSAAPTAESGWPANAKINHGPAILSGV